MNNDGLNILLSTLDEYHPFPINNILYYPRGMIIFRESNSVFF
jgi:hypothetical protein